MKTFSEYIAEEYEKATGEPHSDLVGVHEGLRGTQCPVDAATVAVLPGDAVEGHTFHTPPNPYMKMPHSRLLEMIRSGDMPPDDERLARTAIKLQNAG